jgi:hypothetical protein
MAVMSIALTFERIIDLDGTIALCAAVDEDGDRWTFGADRRMVADLEMGDPVQIEPHQVLTVRPAQ